MKTFRQIGAVTLMNLRSLPQRLGTSAVIVIGIAGVVAVLVSVLAMSTGMLRTLTRAGAEDRVIVLRNGSASEMGSNLARDAVRLIADAPGIKRDAAGKPLVSVETLRLVNLFKQSDGSEVMVTLRGVGPQALAVRPEMKLIAGRMFRPAVNEIIVGKAAKAQFRNMNLGDQITTRGATWTVVGVFTSDGSSHESELIADAETVNGADHRSGFASVIVRLASPQDFQKFKDALSANPALAVDVSREREYYQRQSETIGKVISVVAYVVGGIMAIGAIFGALNTMYSAVSERLREIATLRALGFGATAMVISVLAEALLLAFIGGAIGAALAWLFFNGHVVGTTAGGVNGHLIFELSVSAQLITIGIVWACVIGLIGGLFPAVRAARLQVVEALRAV